MSIEAPVFEAEVFLHCKNSLGEGILWDSKANLLRWIDINTSSVHSLDLETMKYAVDSYPEASYLSFIAVRKDHPGLLATTQHHLVLVDVSEPETVATQVEAKPHKVAKYICAPLVGKEDPDVRFNDCGVDPKGRMFAGSMQLKGPKTGELIRVEADGKEEVIFKGVGCANGTGWSPDGKTMYWVDSAIPELGVYDYNLETGMPSNRRVLATTPEMLDGSKPSGCFDGLTMDGVGNVWVSRWHESRIVGYSPEGKILAQITTPGCLQPTIPCFGGKDLSTMYIASADAVKTGQATDPNEYPNGGNVFKLDFGPDSPIRKILGEGWKGAERHMAAF